LLPVFASTSSAIEFEAPPACRPAQQRQHDQNSRSRMSGYAPQLRKCLQAARPSNPAAPDDDEDPEELLLQRAIFGDLFSRYRATAERHIRIAENITTTPPACPMLRSIAYNGR